MGRIPGNVALMPQPWAAQANAANALGGGQQGGGQPQGLTEAQLRGLQWQQAVGQQQQQQTYNQWAGTPVGSVYNAYATLGPRLNQAMGAIGQTSLRNAQVARQNAILNAMWGVAGGTAGGGIGSTPTSFDFLGPNGQRFGGVQPGSYQSGVDATPGKVWNPQLGQQTTEQLGRMTNTPPPQVPGTFADATAATRAQQSADLGRSLSWPIATGMERAGRMAEADQTLAAQIARANSAARGGALQNRLYGQGLANDLQSRMLQTSVLRSLLGLQRAEPTAGGTFWPFV